MDVLDNSRRYLIAVEMELNLVKPNNVSYVELFINHEAMLYVSVNNRCGE